MNQPKLGESLPLVPPLYQSSVYSLPDLDAIDRIYEGKAAGFVYARDDHPNAQMLASQLATLESAQWAVMCGSGMSAISAAVLAIVQQGDQIIASDRLYGRTVQLLEQQLSRLSIKTNFVDLIDLSKAKDALRQPARLMIVETLSNPLLRLVDVASLATMCHERGCRLLVDNTFTPPPLLRPLELGADLVVESLTKFIAGHGDVTLGAVCGRDDLREAITQVMRIWGFMSSPFECWLALRGMETLPLRVEAACQNAAALADWLAEQPGVGRVVYPGRQDHPEHALAKKMLDSRFGHMLCFELTGGRAAVNRFMRGASRITFSPSLGHTATTCSHPGSTSHRFCTPEERQRLGIGDGLVRLSVGIEPWPQIRDEISKGLTAREGAR